MGAENSEERPEAPSQRRHVPNYPNGPYDAANGEWGGYSAPQQHSPWIAPGGFGPTLGPGGGPAGPGPGPYGWGAPPPFPAPFVHRAPVQLALDVEEQLEKDAEAYRPLPQGKNKIALWVGMLAVVAAIMSVPLFIDTGEPGDYPGDPFSGKIQMGTADNLTFTGPEMKDCYDSTQDSVAGGTYTCGNVQIDSTTMVGNSDLDVAFTRGIRLLTNTDPSTDMSYLETKGGEWSSRVSALHPGDTDDYIVAASFKKAGTDDETVVVTVTSDKPNDSVETMEKIYESIGLDTTAVAEAFKDARNNPDQRRTEEMPDRGTRPV